MNEFMVRKSRSKKLSPSVAFGEKKGIWDNYLNEWMVKEVANDVWLTFDLRLLKRISTQKTNAFLGWLFSSAAMSSLPIIFKLVTFPKTNRMNWISQSERRSFTDWSESFTGLNWMHGEVVTRVIKLTMAKLTCITKQEIPEIVRKSCSFHWMSRPYMLWKVSQFYSHLFVVANSSDLRPTFR